MGRNLCPKAYTRYRSAAALACNVCAPAVLILSARRTAIFWLTVVYITSWSIALSAALYAANGARAQGTPPMPVRVAHSPAQSVWLVDGIAPYDPACRSDGVERAPMPPMLVVEYATVDAFCTSDGSGSGRLSFTVTGKCRLVQWEGITLEQRCVWLPVLKT